MPAKKKKKSKSDMHTIKELDFGAWLAGIDWARARTPRWSPLL